MIFRSVYVLFPSAHFLGLSLNALHHRVIGDHRDSGHALHELPRLGEPVPRAAVLRFVRARTLQQALLTRSFGGDENISAHIFGGSQRVSVFVDAPLFVLLEAPIGSIWHCRGVGDLAISPEQLLYVVLLVDTWGPGKSTRLGQPRGRTQRL